MSRFISDHEDTTTTDGKTITVKYTDPKYVIRKVVYVAQESINEIADAVAKRLPTVEPRKGKWVQRPGGYICIYMCSECGAVGHRTAFCPHCGARMENK